MASPLLTYANNTLTAATNAKTAADGVMVSTNASLKAAQTTLGQKTYDLAAAVNKIAEIRSQLALIPTTDDGTALLAQLNAAIIDARAKQAAVLTAEEAVVAATADVAKASAVVGDSAARLADAKSVLAQITPGDDERQKLRAAGTAAPLLTLKADSAAALTAAPFTAADTRLDGDLPAKLRGRAEAGQDREVSLVRRREEVEQATHTATVDKAGAVEKQKDLLAKAQSALSDYVANAARRFNEAITLLTKVADPNQGALTPDEIKSIQSQNPDGTPDATLKTARETAADAAKDVDVALKALDLEQSKVEIAIVNAIATDADADPELDAAVIAARTAAATAAANLSNKRGAYSAAAAATLDKWEAAVPDPTFQLLADFHTAKQILTALSTEDPATRIADLDAAEAALVTALTAADKQVRTLDRLREETARDSALAAAAAGAGSRRAFSALRGDFE